jgi:23S rRNA pseudouridine1911/1915/1917 synthase
MCERQIELTVDEGGTRLDKFLAERVTGLSRSAIRRLIDTAQVLVNGDPAKASYKVRPGDLVAVCMPQPEPEEPVAEAIPLGIVYEDQAMIVVNKPAGMVIHPAPGHRSGTLVNALLAHCPDLAGDSGDARPGIVHRLDRDTSGLILVAKNEPIRRALQRQFKARQVHKVYVALLDGHLEAAHGRIEAPLGRDPRRRQRMAVVPGGREAITEYRLLASFAGGDYSLVEAEPKTGRTHQIRVHFASIGHPVVGDTVYGRRRTRLPVPRQFLHAQRLGFTHPLTGQPLEFEAPLPIDLAAVLHLLEHEG